MENNTKIKILIVVMGIILLSALGFTYAFFTADITGNEDSTTIMVTGGVLVIDYDGGSKIEAKNVMPSNNPIAIKKFSVTGNNTTELSMPYTLTLEVEVNEFSTGALNYLVTAENKGEAGNIIPPSATASEITQGKGTYYLGGGNFGMGSGVEHSYTLNIYWPYLDDVDQSGEMGSQFAAYVKVVGEVADEVFKTVDYTSTEDSVSVNVVPSYNGVITLQEFSLDGENWTTEPYFTELDSASTYTVFVRLTNTDGEYINETVEVHTKGVPTPEIPANNIAGVVGTNNWFSSGLTVEIDQNTVVNPDSLGSKTPILTEYQIVVEETNNTVAYIIKGLEQYNDAKLVPLNNKLMATTVSDWMVGNSFTLDADGIYTVNIRNTNSATKEVSTQTKLFKIDTTEPTPMTVFEAWRGKSLQLDITLGGMDGISFPVSYKYYLNDMLVATSNDRSYEFINLEPQTSYTWKIEAVNAAGLVREISGSGYTLSPLAGALDFTPFEDYITVALNVTDEDRVDYIEYSINDGQDWTTNYQFSNLKPATSYTIMAQIIDTEGQTIPAGQIVAYTKGVTIPTHTIASANAQGWYTEDVIVTINPNLNGSTNIKTEYQINNGGWITGTTASVVEDGINIVNYRNVNTKTNEISEGTVKVKLDKTAPTMMAVFEDHKTDTIDVKILGGGTDTVSKVTYTYILNDGNEITKDSKTHTFEGVSSSSNTIKVIATNEAGLTTTYTGTTNNNSPAMAGVLSYTSTKTSIIATMTVNYPANVARYEYSINNVNWTASGVFNGLVESTVYTIYGRMITKTGETIPVESIKASTRGVSKPTHTVPTPDGLNGWHVNDVTIVLQSNQVGSADVTTEYRINDGNWIKGNIILVSNEGVHTITYRNVNVATGETESNSLEIKLDKTKPTTIFANVDFNKKDIKFNLSSGGTDLVSGNVTYKYFLNDETVPRASGIMTSYTFTGLIPNTSYKVTVVATDEAGNSTSYTKTYSTASELTPVITYTSNKTEIVIGVTGVDSNRIDYIDYSINGTIWQTNINTFAVDEASTYTLYACVYDIYDDGTPVCAETITAYSKGVPTPQLNIPVVDGENGWFITSPTLTIDKNKSGTTGITTEYNIGSGWVTGTTIDIVKQGITQVYYRNVNDGTLEKSEFGPVAVKYTETIPTQMIVNTTVNKTNILVSITDGGTDEYTESVSYKYYLNGSLKKETTEKEYEFKGLTPGGEYNLKIEAINSAGLIREYISDLGNTKGELDVYLTGESNTLGTQIDVVIHADDLGRIASKVFTLKGDIGIITNNHGTFAGLTPGSTYTIDCEYTDTLGGTYNATQITVYTKVVPKPTITTVDGNIGNNGWYISDSVTINFQKNQVGNTPLITVYKLGNDEWSTVENNKLTISNEGIHTITYANKNTATNEYSEETTIQIKLDKTAPSIPSVTSIVRKYDVNLKIDSGGTDLLSGVTLQYYKCIAVDNCETIGEPTTATSKYITDLAAGATYIFKIVATNGAGLISEWSNTIKMADELVINLGYTPIDGGITINTATFPDGRVSSLEFDLNGVKSSVPSYSGLKKAATYTLKATLVDNFGGTVTDEIVVYTKGVPTPTHEITNSNSFGWYTGVTPATVTINSNTAGYGDNVETYYQINNGPWEKGIVASVTTEKSDNVVNYKNVNKYYEATEIATGSVTGIKYDNTAPSEIIVNTVFKKTEIDVVVTPDSGNDNISNPIKYEFYLNNNNYGESPKANKKEFTYTGLTANTAYTIKIVATNAAGISTTYVAVASETTKPELSGILTYIADANTNTITASIDDANINRPGDVLRKEYAIGDNITEDSWTTNPVFNVDPSSTYKIHGRLVDNLGGKPQVGSIDAYSKGLAEPTLDSINGTAGSSGWYISDVELLINQNKNGNTDIKTYYRINSTSENDWIEGTLVSIGGGKTGIKVPLTSNGTHNVYYKNKNFKTGEVKESGPIEVILDKN